MNCDKTDCIHYKVCEEWKSLGNDNYINDSYGNCDHYSMSYDSASDLVSRSWVEHNVLSLVDAETRIYAQGRLDSAPTVEAYTSEDIVKYISATEDLVREKLERLKGKCIGNASTSWECSCCGYGVNPWNNTPFCPNCGAKMNDEGKPQEESNNMRWDEPSSKQEESEHPNDKTFINVHDHNDGIFDPTYINDEVDCSDFGIYPWGDS